jgi:type IV pilus assembly protein PilB
MPAEWMKKMGILKKLVSGNKAADKNGGDGNAAPRSDGNRIPPTAAPVPASSQPAAQQKPPAAQPRPATPAQPQNPIAQDPAAPVNPVKPTGKAPAPGAGSTTHAGSMDEFRRQMNQLARQEEGKLEKDERMVSPDEQASRIRGGGQGLPELSVSGEADMLQLLSEQAGLKYVRLGDYPKQGITPELLSIIPSEIARSYRVFPIQLKSDGTIVIAITDPLNVRIIDDLRLFLVDERIHDVEGVVANEEEIIDYINLYYGVGDETLEQMVDKFEKEDNAGALAKSEAGSYDLTDLDQIAQSAPVIKFCNLLLLQAVKERASDIHIEPFSGVLRIRYRVDGVLREIPTPPKSWQLGIISRFKVMSNMDISETRRPQDGRIKLTIDGREIDMRVSTLPVVHGECVAMRLLDKSMMMIGIRQIGMTQDVLERFMKIVERPNGILLVTGPTGSGKTTTLYAALNEVNDPTEKIITTEDPVEYQLEGLVQVNINANVGLTFARCLRSILRQDPDVILVGEIRDVETAQIAIQASLTGHLVFSTLHTNSAAATVTRLIDMGVEPFLITSTLEGIVAQRLVRMICANCKRPYQPTDEELSDFGTNRQEVGDITFFKGVGCDECHHTGYKGRLGIFELLPVSEEVKTLILEHATTDQIQEVAIQQGMKTMRQDGWLKICLGVTTFEEVARHTPRESDAMIRAEMESLLRETVGAGMDKEPKPTVSMSALGQPVEPPSAAKTPWIDPAAKPQDIGDAAKPK